jgi:hypothetical protein
MSPADVVAASRGDASLDSNAKTTPGGAVEAVTGTYASGMRRFTSRFDFTNGKLSMVLLTQTEGDCTTLRTELLSRYGAPSREFEILTTTEWDDPKTRNNIEYLFIGGQCKISYTPLVGYSPNKL